MSGHSKWATIHRQKESTDQKRGAIFTKVSTAIIVAVKDSGGVTDPELNFKLRLAIEKARSVNMPKDNVERAIQKGTGDSSGDIELFECLYEGYGPHGVAMMIEILTDNKNRTVPEIRKIFGRFGGSMGEAGCVSWMFEKKGLIIVNSSNLNEDDLMMLALDAGAEDLQKIGDVFQVI